MSGFAVAVFGVTGLAFGSFVTVLVHRLPEKRSIVAPRSACGSCGAQVAARDNVPILSYAVLGGRCRNCRTHISAEYPIVEALVASLFVAAALLVRPVWVAALIAPFLGVMVAAALIDARHRIIPNRLTYPSILVAATAILVVWVAGGGLSIAGAAVGMVAYGGSLYLIALVALGILGSDGMGMGDVKLAALIGLVLGAIGLRYVAAAALLGILAGGAGALVALAAGRGMKGQLPFGPFLAGGAVVAALAGNPLVTWYLGLAR